MRRSVLRMAAVHVALVLVCAAGAPPDQVSDLIKEVEILQAHSNRPVVVCDADTVGLWPTDLVLPIPPAAPQPPQTVSSHQPGAPAA